jgi:hypothetical protein
MADNWLLCALVERDWPAAEQALKPWAIIPWAMTPAIL